MRVTALNYTADDSMLVRDTVMAAEEALDSLQELLCQVENNYVEELTGRERSLLTSLYSIYQEIFIYQEILQGM